MMTDDPSERPPVLDAERCRRFTLGDAMILVAAVAVGLAISRFGIEFMWRDLSRIQVPRLDTWMAWKNFLFGPNQLAINATRFANLIVLNNLVWLVLAVVLIRLRRPRPPLRALWRQPGFAACASPVVGFAVCLLASLVIPESPVASKVFGGGLVAVGPLSWLILRGTRTWRAEPGWIDRLGRVIGLLLMASLVCYAATILINV